jgi:hypothetical protein
VVVVVVVEEEEEEEEVVVVVAERYQHLQPFSPLLINARDAFANLKSEAP